MGDPAGQLDLELEPVEEARIGREHLVAQDLERHHLVELLVLGAVDDAHPALAQGAEDLVAAGEEAALVDLHSARGSDSLDHGRGLVAPGRDRGIGPHALLEEGHPLAKEADHLVLLPQVGEERVEGAGQGADLVLGVHGDRTRERALARALDQAHERAHRAGDPGRGRVGQAQGQRHHHQRHHDQDVAELPEGRGLLGHAAHRGHRPHRFPARGLQGHLDPHVLVAAQVQGERLVVEGLELREVGAERALLGPERRDREHRSLAGVRGEEGDLAVGELLDLAGQGFVDPVAGDQDPHQVAAHRHRNRHRVEELIALTPHRERVLPGQRLHHDRVLREVVALDAGPVAPRENGSVHVGRDHEVGGDVAAALLEGVEHRVVGVLAALVHHALDEGLEGRLVAEGAQAEPQLVEAIGLEGLPHPAGLGEPAVDVGAGQAVGLHGGRDQGDGDERDHDGAREEQDLLGESHEEETSSISRRPNSPSRTCSCGARA
jgi:hypothetical protein